MNFANHQMKMNSLGNLIFLPLIFFAPKLSADIEGLDTQYFNLYYHQGWIHATCHFYEEGLIKPFPADDRIKLQLKAIEDRYPSYFVSNTIKLLSKKFPKCTKGLFLEEEYLGN